MNAFPKLLFAAAFAAALSAQTAEELVNRNLQAKGGLDKIKAIHSVRATGKVQQGGGLTIQVGSLSMAPNLLRQSFTIQGMTQIQAYDGTSGWKISPFDGRKDPELLGDDELRGLVLLAGIAAIFVVRSAWFNGKVRQFIVGTVEKATGGRVEVATFRFDWKHLRAEVHEFVLHGKEPADKPPLFRAGSVVVGLKLVSILRRDVDIQSLTISDLRVYLIVGADGRTNFPEPKVPPTGKSSTVEDILKLAIGRFNLERGIFEVRSEEHTSELQ